MSSVTYTIFLLATVVVLNPFADTWASTITTLDVPLVIRNGTGPIDLSCIYEIQENENGLVIKWYHESDQIYQWIPPMLPQDVGVINGIARYPKNNLKYPNSRSIIRLDVVTVEMGGEYTCTISTFQEEDSRKTRMIVYVPETNLTIYASPFNETHFNLTCTVNGAQPRPTLRYFVEGIEINRFYEDTEEPDQYKENLVVKRRAIVKNSMEPILVDCEISIPNTDYKRRERIIYYPTRSLSQTSGAIGRCQTASFNVFVVITCMHLLILIFKKCDCVSYGGGDDGNWWGKISRSSDPPDYHLLFGIQQQRIEGQISVSPNSTGLSRYRSEAMNRTCVIVFFAVCALWTVGETLSCDQCGRECADICGTRQFRACCFNNMKKRQYDFGLKLWMRPRRHHAAIYLRPDYDIY